MSRGKKPTTVYLEEDQLDKLRALSHKTDVPIAVYIRRGVSYILGKADAAASDGGKT